MAPAPQFELASPPRDAISSLAFAPRSPHHLLIGSWDRFAYLYDLRDGEPGVLVQRFEHRAPVLDVCFGADDDEAFTAGVDRRVMRINLATGEQTAMSEHSEPVRCVVYSPQHALLVSASWDSTLHFHNLHAPFSSPIAVSLPGKPHALAVSPSKLVVAMTARLVSIYDLHTVAVAIATATASPSVPPPTIEPWQQRESSLKFLTRAVACMPNDAGYATSSIEGRVAVEWFEDTPESQARKYAFKCHRATEPADAASADADADDQQPVDVVYPVNALAFHPVHGTFASGGGDGHVALWDADAKRRMKQYQKFPHSVAALAFSSNGQFLAVGVCPGFESGQEDYSAEGLTKVFVRELGESEAKGKGAK